MRIYGIRVDTDKIAQGLFSLCRNDDLEALAFGMPPASLMQPLERVLKKKFDEIAAVSIGSTTAEIAQALKELGVENILEVDATKRREFVNAVITDVHCKLLTLGNCRL